MSDTVFTCPLMWCVETAGARSAFCVSLKLLSSHDYDNARRMPLAGTMSSVLSASRTQVDATPLSILTPGIEKESGMKQAPSPPFTIVGDGAR